MGTENEKPEFAHSCIVHGVSMGAIFGVASMVFLMGVPGVITSATDFEVEPRPRWALLGGIAIGLLAGMLHVVRCPTRRAPPAGHASPP